MKMGLLINKWYILGKHHTVRAILHNFVICHLTLGISCRNQTKKSYQTSHDTLSRMRGRASMQATVKISAHR